MNKDIRQTGRNNIYAENMIDSQIIVGAKEQSDESVLRNMKALSSSLLKYHSSFDNDDKISIPRNEVIGQIRNFISKDSERPEDSVLLLTGEAGMGKTVLMKQLFGDLVVIEDYLVISMKADIFTPKTLEELEDYMELHNQGFVDFISSIDKQNSYKRIVLLVDQIDALSQVLSNDRRAINVYTNLISALEQIDSVRIIVSTREFDLANDSLIKSLSRNNLIRVPELNEEDVKDTLKRANCKGPFSPELISFLRTPLHLRLFILAGINKVENEVFTLSKLYDALWKRLDTSKTLHLLQYLSNRMYDNQNLSVHYDHLISEGYKEATDLLLSDGFLVQTNNDQVQFLHQSLFDYTYARCFVSESKSLSVHLRTQHQGLFIRLRVKQILLYLRDQNPKNYIKELGHILSQPKDYKFHLRLLIIQLLAGHKGVLQPEYDYVQSRILNDASYRNIFLHSIRNLEWITWLHHIGELKLIAEQKGEDYNTLRHVFNNLPSYNDENRVTEFIKSIKSDPLYHELIITLIERAHHSSLHLLGEIYQEIEPCMEKHSSFFWERVVEHAPEKAIPFFIKYFKEVYDKEKQFSLDISHDFDSVLDKLFERCPKQACQMGLQIIHDACVEHVIEYSKSDSLIDCFFYTDFNEDIHISKIQDLLFLKTKDVLISLTESSDSWATEELDQLIESDYRVMVLMGVWICHTSDKISDELLNRIFNRDKIWQSSRTILNYHLGLFIKKYHSLLSSEQFETFYNMIEKIKFNYENKYYKSEGPVTKYGLTRRGMHIYQYLCCFPEERVLSSPTAEKNYRELKRKYKDEMTPCKPSSIYWSHDKSLSDETMKKLSPKKLLELIKGVDTTVHHLRKDERKLTTRGVISSFESLIESDWEKYYPFIKEIISDNEVRDGYITAAIRKLIYLKVDVSCIVELYTAILNDPIRRESTSIELIWSTDYLIENKRMPEIVFDFLENRALTVNEKEEIKPKDKNFDERPLKPSDLISYGINHNQGAAIRNLMRCYTFTEYHERIIKAVEKVSLDTQPSTKAVIISYLALLNHIDIDKVLNIYLQLVKDGDELLLGVDLNNLHPLIYLPNHKFNALIPVYEKAIKSEMAAKPASISLFFAWLNNQEEAHKLLLELIDKIKPSAWKELVRYIFDYISKEEYEDKCFTMYEHIINIDNEGLAQTIGNQIRFSKDCNATLQHKIIDSYVESVAAKYNITGINTIIPNFKLTNSRDVIHWELNLLKNSHNHDNEFVYRKALEIMIEAYQAISKYSFDDALLNEAINQIDEALEHVQSRNVTQLGLITEDSIWEK